jgi:hypothetical protein
MSLFTAAAMLLPVSVVVTLTSASPASASCSASPFTGKWLSSSSRLRRIDVWFGGDDCQLYAKAWSKCKNDPTRVCSWSSRSKALQGGGGPNFRFFYYNWSDSNEVLHLRLQDSTHMSVWDHIDYDSGEKWSTTVPMTKAST